MRAWPSIPRLWNSTSRQRCRGLPDLDAIPDFLQTQSFRPGRPKPTYRYAEAV